MSGIDQPEGVHHAVDGAKTCPLEADDPSSLHGCVWRSLGCHVGIMSKWPRAYIVGERVAEARDPGRRSGGRGRLPRQATSAALPKMV